MTETTKVTPIFEVSNKVYDFLLALVKYVLPAIVALYLGLAGLWGFPNPEAIAGTIALVTTFLGVFLSIMKRKYVALHPEPEPAGDILVDVAEDGFEAMTVALNEPLNNIRDKGSVVFNVVTSESTSSRE